MRRAPGRPSTTPYRWSDDGLGYPVGPHRNIVGPAVSWPSPHRMRRGLPPSCRPAPGSKGNLGMYKSVRGLNSLIVTRHIPGVGCMVCGTTQPKDIV
jgi:hypothetical protein